MSPSSFSNSSKSAGVTSIGSSAGGAPMRRRRTRRSRRHSAGRPTGCRAATGRSAIAGCIAALPPGPGEPGDDHDERDLQQQAEHRGEAAHAAHEAVTEQHAEQAGADEARGETAEQSAAEHAAAEQARLRGWHLRPRPDPRRCPGAAACVMLRSIGAARGAVLVAAGAEYVRLPRLPELLDERASTEATVNASAATTANNASIGRWKRSMVFPQVYRLGSRPGAQFSSDTISVCDSAP